MKAARARSTDRRPRVAAPAKRASARRKPSAIARAVEQLPISREALRRLGNWTLGIGIGGGVVAGLIAMGLPQMIGLLIADGIGDAGFKVRNVEILNRRQVDSAFVYDVAMRQQARPMPLVDLDGTRAELMKMGWIADARVSRRLPDTLVVDIVERVPAAIWQYQHRLALIDKDGVVIGPVDDRAMPDLPVVVGPGANRRATQLAALMAAAPSLKPLVTAASWQGDRRWDIIFQSGEKLMLPEGDQEAAKALAFFAQEDRRAGMLGKGLVSIDLRDPSRMVARMSREPGSKIEPAAPSLSAKSVT
ncbi:MULTISPECIES: cell division protein FtsQ/DivIB [unclassified Sphingomonas]|uniref:cell division protein FtsQ/DivIB n=1 Tax=unclassified Sphingomonas TaxID=196159 RepID=UPI0006FEA4C7|nr:MULTISPECIES: cell division protein FtsQ/DivIB [unclassified Sphingomonas]KQX17827.1 transposase [Sphingomonas sp. Root1294]KQY70753.1 transposase [Sphingomonas sp. Root50]KRB91754.1 transposase [Sphingomonas sp. Root720]